MKDEMQWQEELASRRIAQETQAHLARFFVAGLLMAFRGMSASTANWEVQQAWKHTRAEEHP